MSDVFRRVKEHSLDHENVTLKLGIRRTVCHCFFKAKINLKLL